MADVETPAPVQTDGPSKADALKEAANKDAEKAVCLLAQGKRNLLCGDVPQAVQQLQESCRLLAGKYGDTGDELGEAYLVYGTALLDLARMESGVLGNALQGIDENTDDEKDASSADEMTEEEREKISDQIIDAMTEERQAPAVNGKAAQNGSDSHKENGTAVQNGEAKAVENGEAKAVENGEAKAVEKGEAKAVENGKAKDVENGKAKDVENGAEPMETDVKKDSEEGTTEDDNADAESEDIGDEEEGEGEEAEAEDGEEDAKEEGEEKMEEDKKDDPAEEEVSNLQLAWEVLELAKVIYSRHEDKEKKLKTAETHLKLGEVGLETEQYEQAIDDFKKCLTIQEEHLEKDSRLIAETHYQIGLACCFSQHYDDSLEHLNKAVRVINAKIHKLQAVIDEAGEKGKEPTPYDDPLSLAHKEIKDLKDILPDILAKIEDTEDEKKSQDKVKQLVKDNLNTDSATTSTGFGEASTSSSDTKAVSDISHLVRKKRKSVEDVEEEASKKPRTEEPQTNTETKMDESTEKKSEEKKAEATEEKKAEATEEKKAEATEEKKAEATEEKKAEATEEKKAEATEEKKAETTEEKKAEKKAETTEEKKSEDSKK